MKLININKDEFDKFVYSSNCAHFFKTSAWGEVSKSRNYISHLLGLYDDNNKLAATTLLLEKKILMYSTFYSPRGFTIDYDDEELLATMLEEVKKYVKKHHGLYYRFDPDIILHKLDEECNVIEENKHALELIDFFKKHGGRHKGFTIRFNEASLPRFTFRVDISADEDTILSRMHPKTRKVFKNENTGIEVFKGNLDSVIDFHETMKETARRKKLYLEPLKFFTDYYEILNKHDMSDIYVAKVNIKEVITNYQTKINEINQTKKELLANMNKKTKGKLNDLDNQLNKLNKELKELETINEDEVILSSVITAKFKDKVWLIHGGNKDILQFLNANYWLYYTIMMDSKKDGYKLVDFFGSEGKIDKNSDLYGIYLFKSRFGGDFIEFIGEFDFVLRPMMNAIINKLLVIRRKLLMKKAIKEIQNEAN